MLTLLVGAGSSARRWGTAVRAIVIASGVIALCPAIAAGASGACGDPTSRPWCRADLSPDRRATLLLRALTQSERISLLEGDDLVGVVGGANNHTGTSNGIDRLGVPTVHFTDGTAGIRQGAATAMPVSIAVAATFDPALARLGGQLLGVEARDKGNDVLFGPTLTIMRTPLAGRTFQAFGEDPLLQSWMGAAEIAGIQSRGVIANANIMAANTQEGYSPLADTSRPGQALGPGATEGSRYTHNAIVDQRALREIYLPPFEAAVRGAHVGTVMCAYNRVNGTFSCENRFLLSDVLRGWGFTGFTLSDYGAAHSASSSLRNGLDFEPWPPGGAYSPTNVMAALSSGQATITQVNTHVKSYLRTLFAFGVFDRKPYSNNPGAIDRAAGARTAERIEESAVTLLSNRRGVLPLNAGRLHSIAVLGAGANAFVTGGGSSNVTPFSYTTAVGAIVRRAGGHVRVRSYSGADPAQAAALAGSSDAAIVIAPDYLTEGVDRRCLTLECPPAFGDQDQLIGRVAAANRRTIVVLETGGPVLTPWRNRVAGLLEAWYPGEEGGSAIARVLFGDADPGGRLPVTFPASAARTPTAGDRSSYPGIAEKTVFKEGVFVGYRWYDVHRVRPAFPFGFGMSCTRFAYGPLRVRAQHDRTRPVQASVTIANVGSRAGIDVPQLYLDNPSPGPQIPQPPRQLRGFERVALRAGARADLTFTVTARDLAWWDTRAQGWRVATGCYKLFVGSSSRDLPSSATIAIGATRCQHPAARVQPPSAASIAASLL